MLYKSLDSAKDYVGKYANGTLPADEDAYAFAADVCTYKGDSQLLVEVLQANPNVHVKFKNVHNAYVPLVRVLLKHHTPDSALSDYCQIVLRVTATWDKRCKLNLDDVFLVPWPTKCLEALFHVLDFQVARFDMSEKVLSVCTPRMFTTMIHGLAYRDIAFDYLARTFVVDSITNLLDQVGLLCGWTSFALAVKPTPTAFINKVYGLCRSNPIIFLMVFKSLASFCTFENVHLFLQRAFPVNFPQNRVFRYGTWVDEGYMASTKFENSFFEKARVLGWSSAHTLTLFDTVYALIKNATFYNVTTCEDHARLEEVTHIGFARAIILYLTRFGNGYDVSVFVNHVLDVLTRQAAVASLECEQCIEQCARPSKLCSLLVDHECSPDFCFHFCKKFMHINDRNLPSQISLIEIMATHDALKPVLVEMFRARVGLKGREPVLLEEYVKHVQISDLFTPAQASEAIKWLDIVNALRPDMRAWVAKYDHPEVASRFYKLVLGSIMPRLGSRLVCWENFDFCFHLGYDEWPYYLDLFVESAPHAEVEMFFKRVSVPSLRLVAVLRRLRTSNQSDLVFSVIEKSRATWPDFPSDFLSEMFDAYSDRFILALLTRFQNSFVFDTLFDWCVEQHNANLLVALLIHPCVEHINPRILKKMFFEGCEIVWINDEIMTKFASFDLRYVPYISVLFL